MITVYTAVQYTVNYQISWLVVFITLTHPLPSSLVPGPPLGIEGEAVGSNGILLSWTMPPGANNIDGYVIR